MAFSNSSRNSSGTVSGFLSAAVAVAACSSSGAMPLDGGLGSGDVADSTASDSDGGFASEGGTFSSGDDGLAPVGDGCASANVTVSRVIPSIWLILGSDLNAFNTYVTGPVTGTDPPYWNVLHTVLLDPGGVVPTLQDVAAFGLIFDGADSDGTSCPVFQPSAPVAPTLHSEAALSAAYPVGWTTPTAANLFTDLPYYALRYVSTHLPSAQQKASDPTVGAQVVVLATEGAPWLSCYADWTGGTFADGGAPLEAQDDQAVRVTLGLVSELAAQGVRVYVLSGSPTLAYSSTLGSPDDDQLAAAGGTGQALPMMSQADLVSALSTVTAQATSCDVTLNGTVAAGEECNGSVTVDGTPIACDTADGWQLKDPSTIELVGKACAGLRAKPEATIHADFPCRVFTPTR
jgi:hypothetical protein